MLAIDTNVLIRILIDDPKQIEQVKTARQFAKKTGQFFIPQIVQVEVVWVLDVTYGLEKNEIIFILRHLQENEAFVLQNESNFASALHLYQTTNVNFSDCLILAESQYAGCELVTFDKKFSRLPKVKLLDVMR